MHGAVSLCEAPQEHSAQYSCGHSTYVLVYTPGLESPSHFFWDEKCYGQDCSDRSGSDGPVLGPSVRIINGPAKSTPMKLNAGPSFTLLVGKGGGGGA